MAVTDVTSNPGNVVVLTAQGDSWSAPGDRRFKITGIRWVGVAVAATDHLVIQNAASKTVYEDYCNCAAGASYGRESKVFKEFTYWSSFTISTLSSGTVYIYYE